MVRDPTLLAAIQERVRSLQEKNPPPGENAKRWKALVGDLRRYVLSFPALPKDEPALSDAVYCLFLHALAVRTTRLSAAWPKAVARRLGITGATDVNT